MKIFWKTCESFLFAAFTRWFLGRFAVIFTRKSYSKAFGPFIELNGKILNLFRDKEPNRFATLINEYVCTLQELMVIVSTQFSETHSTKLKLNTFVTSEPIVLSVDCLLNMEGLELGSILECTLLQNSITKVFTCSMFFY